MILDVTEADIKWETDEPAETAMEHSADSARNYLLNTWQYNPDSLAAMDDEGVIFLARVLSLNN